MTKSASAEQTSPTKDRHGWIHTETVKTRFGNFEFKNGYPTREAADALLDQLIFNRAIEVYLTQIPAVGLIESRRGVREFGATHPNQVIIWETLMDAKSLVLTANTETVYGMGFLDLKSDGATVFEAPPKMLGAAMDILQRFLVDIGPVGPDKGKGGKYLFLPPDYTGDVPQGYFVVKSSTYSINFFVRGFKENGKTDPAVALMKQMKIYPLAKVAEPPKMEFLNGSGQPIDTIHSDTIVFFESLAQLVNEEPAEIFTPLERFHMQCIGIEKGKEFKPDSKMSTLLSDAARSWRRDGARQLLRVARSGYVLLQRSPVAMRRRHTLHLPEGWRAGGGSPGIRLLHGARQLAGNDVQEYRRGLSVPVDVSGCGRRLPRWREELHFACPTQDSCQ